MDVKALVVVSAVLFGWGLVSARARRAGLTPPIVFVGVGGLLAWSGLVGGVEAVEELTPLVEVTLVWVLFSDAARLRLAEVRRDLGAYGRLLGIGLPLTILLGWGLAAWFFPDLGIWFALLIGAALAPTDAALGVPVVTNPAVPRRIRELITVESGLNDGIATPVVMFAIAGAAAAIGLDADHSRLAPAVQLLLGAVAGSAAVAIGANGFVAAFCGGLAFGACAGRRGTAELEYLEQTGTLVSLLVWLTFGVVAIPIMLERLSPLTVLYAVLSLTVVRMLPVALALIGTGLGRESVGFIGWFGPRGLASLVFALLALEALGGAADEAVAVIATTVLLSVVAHGLTAAPLATRFGRRSEKSPIGP